MKKKSYINLIDSNLQKSPDADENGIYIIHAVHPDGKPQTLDRVAGQDRGGILYIGKASDQTLFERVSDFKKAIDPDYKSENHSGGRSYNASEALKAMIKPEDMGVALFAVKNEPPQEAETRYLTATADEWGAAGG